MIFSTIIKESPIGTYRAEIHQDSSGYRIEYFNPNEEKIKIESYPGYDVRSVVQIAETWTKGIQTLNG